MNVKIGKKIRQTGGFSAFVPAVFPPEELMQMPQDILLKASTADRLLGTLDGLCVNLPGFEVFTKLFAAQDATASSQIEGTKATLNDALQKEAQQKAPQLHNSSKKNTKNSTTMVPTINDADDIIFHWKALQYGVKRLKTFPLSLRLIREVHKKLMQGGRSTHFADPGHFRKSQNYIGGTGPSNARFVPPPVFEMQQALNDLEKFLHNTNVLPLVHAALTHAQFEAIHPFLDGNGRTGRILIALVLHQRKILNQPVLFLSSYFKQHQKEYYRLLNKYCEGQVYTWINFFIEGVINISKQAIHKAKKIQHLKNNDMLKVQALSKRESESSAKVLQHLFEQPYVTTAFVMQWTGFTRAGAQKLIDRLVKLKILYPDSDTTTYGRVYAYKAYLHIFNE